jgi:hypothetical protein
LRRHRSLALCGLVLLGAGPVRSQPPPAAPRAEVPIIERVLSNGVRRYGVPMTVGGAQVLAGLDTGAAGLRLLPDAAEAGEVRAGTATETYSFSTGTVLSGVVGQARIAIGGLSGAGSVHLVRGSGCTARVARCPGSLPFVTGPTGYNFLGSGLPGEGFRAFLGANMGPSTIDNPLQAVGARRWIIELPRPGDPAPGRLVLNPTDEELMGFIFLRLVGGFSEPGGGGMHDAVAACLRNLSNREAVCGPMALDSGAFSIRVLNPRLGPTPWPTGAALSLELLDEQRKPAASVRMTLGGMAQTMARGTAPRPESMIQPGVAPYWAYAVLYDPAQRRLGFKPRPAIEGLPRPEPPAP